MAVLELASVRFSYDNRVVLDGVSLDIGEEELLVILGSSGSGKSTVLRLIAGLEVPTAGSISLNERLASADGEILLEPSARGLSLVFQDLALWPHLTCDEQLRFMAPGLGTADRLDLLGDVGLSGFEDRLPAHMSGGERQRLALARALAAKPRMLLLDEPFANLDPGVRVELRRLLLDLRLRHDVTIVYVTHDLDDAFSLADRIAVLNEGKIAQTAPPEELYRHPVSAFVATFVGKAAIVPATVEGRDIHTPLGRFANPRSDLKAGSTIEVVVRPEDVELGSGGFPARVAHVTFGGDRYLVQATTDSDSIWGYTATRFVPGDSVRVRIRTGWPLERSG